MGGRLVTEALAACRWCALVEGAPISERSRLVLLVMAHRALDNAGRNGTPARTYYGGWDYLALMALDYREWVKGGASHKAITRAISELQDRGLIRPAKRYGRLTGYEILPSPGRTLDP